MVIVCDTIHNILCSGLISLSSTTNVLKPYLYIVENSGLYIIQELDYSYIPICTWGKGKWGPNYTSTLDVISI